MNIKRAKEEIERTVKAYLAKDAVGEYAIPAVRQRPILLMGPPGIGKTQIMEQIADETHVGLVSYTLTHHTRQSALGLPYIEHQKFGGQEYRITPRSQETIELEWGGKLEFINSVVGGAIDTRFMPAILKGVMSRMERGPLTGSYARDVRVIVYDGKMHPVDSNEISFTLAGRNAFSAAFKEAGPKILEPIYTVEVYIPSDYMGDIMSDLQSRRAIILGMDSENGYQKLSARVPLAEMSDYSTSLSSITGGRGSFSMKFSNYELVPGDVQEKLIKAFEQENAEE